MKIKPANKLLILGIALYLLAGIAVVTESSYSLIILLIAVIFLAFGFFKHVKSKWLKMFKNKT